MSYYYSYDRPSGYGRYSSHVSTTPYGTRSFSSSSSSYYTTPITSSYVISSRPTSTSYITPTPRGRTYHRSIPVIAHQRLVPVSAPLYSVRPNSYYLDLDHLSTPRFYGARPTSYVEDAFTASIQDLEDEAREMRIQSSSLLHRLQSPSTFHTYQIRNDSEKWERDSLASYRSPVSYAESLILQPIRDVHRNINNMSHYSEPVKKAQIGRSHLACISFAGGKPVSRRRPRFYEDDDKIRSEVLFRSHYERMPRRSASAGPAVCRSRESTAARRASARAAVIEKATQEMKARNDRLQKRFGGEEHKETEEKPVKVRQPSPVAEQVVDEPEPVLEPEPEAAVPEPEPEVAQQEPEPVVEEEKIEPVKEKRKKKKKEVIPEPEPVPEPEPEPVVEPQVEAAPEPEPEPEPVQLEEEQAVAEVEPVREPEPEPEPEPQVEFPESPVTQDDVPVATDDFVDAREDVPIEPLNEEVSIWGDNEEDEMFTKKRRPVLEENHVEEQMETETVEVEVAEQEEDAVPASSETHPLEEFDWGDGEETLPRRKTQYVDDTEE